ncbi:uncharacterized protein LOC120336371 [Styela clava]
MFSLKHDDPAAHGDSENKKKRKFSENLNNNNNHSGDCERPEMILKMRSRDSDITSPKYFGRRISEPDMTNSDFVENSEDSSPRQIDDVHAFLYRPSFNNSLHFDKNQQQSDCDKKFRCEHCDKSFTDPSNLQRHIRQHHVGARAHPCPECGKTFATSSGLKQHQHIHSSVKPFTCEVCHKSYTQFSNLCRHKRMHADCRINIKCENCSQSFPNSSALNKHRRFCESNSIYIGSRNGSLLSTPGTREDDTPSHSLLNQQLIRFGNENMSQQNPDVMPLSKIRKISDDQASAKYFQHYSTQMQPFPFVHNLPNVQSDAYFRQARNLLCGTNIRPSVHASPTTVNKPNRVDVQVQCENPNVDQMSPMNNYNTWNNVRILKANGLRYESAEGRVRHNSNARHSEVQVDIPNLKSPRRISEKRSCDVTPNAINHFLPNLFDSPPKRRSSIDNERDISANYRTASELYRLNWNFRFRQMLDEIATRQRLFDIGPSTFSPAPIPNTLDQLHKLGLPHLINPLFARSFYDSLATGTQKTKHSNTLPAESSPVTDNLNSWQYMKGKKDEPLDLTMNKRTQEDIIADQVRKSLSSFQQSVERTSEESAINPSLFPSSNFQHNKLFAPHLFAHPLKELMPPANDKINFSINKLLGKYPKTETQYERPLPHVSPKSRNENSEINEFSPENRRNPIQHLLRFGDQVNRNPFSNFTHFQSSNLSGRKVPEVVQPRTYEKHDTLCSSRDARGFPMEFHRKMALPYQARIPNLYRPFASAEKKRFERERYVCKYCSKVFPRSANLTRHLRTHTGEQPYSCKYCDRSFSISSNLQRHVRNIHNKERPYSCQFCRRAFGQQTNLERHVRKHLERSEILTKVGCTDENYKDNHNLADDTKEKFVGPALCKKNSEVANNVMDWSEEQACSMSNSSEKVPYDDDFDENDSVPTSASSSPVSNRNEKLKEKQNVFPIISSKEFVSRAAKYGLLNSVVGQTSPESTQRAPCDGVNTSTSSETDEGVTACGESDTEAESPFDRNTNYKNRNLDQMKRFSDFGSCSDTEKIDDQLSPEHHGSHRKPAFEKHFFHSQPCGKPLPESRNNIPFHWMTKFEQIAANTTV